MKDEIHTSMTGLESCFEEELSRADRNYLDPDHLEISRRSEEHPSTEDMDSDPVEDAMHLDK